MRNNSRSNSVAMSIRALLAKSKVEFERTGVSAAIADLQRRGYLERALTFLSDREPNDNQQATVNITANSFDVPLPIDYLCAEEEALLAVEYGYSSSYLSVGDSNINYPFASGYQFGNQINASLQPPHSRRTGSVPRPQVTDGVVKGINRKILKLHSAYTADRTETLIYLARYLVDDDHWEVTINSNPTATSTCIIAGVTITFIASGTTNASNCVIGSTVNFTAKNLARSINASTNTTGVAAKAEGAKLYISGSNDDDVDFSITVDGVKLTASHVDAINNLPNEQETKILNLIDSKSYLYLSTLPSTPAELRKVYSDLAIKLQKDVEDNLGLVTIL